MMNTPNKTITNSDVKGDFNGNHTRLQSKKWPLENQQFKNKDRFLGINKTKILNQSYEKNLGEYSFKD